jgi:hypothetical protein
VARKKSKIRQTRAKQLREQIERLTSKGLTPRDTGESPAAFVHRRMAELEQQARREEEKKQ